jgi:SulP family sulfate permease
MAGITNSIQGAWHRASSVFGRSSDDMPKPTTPYLSLKTAKEDGMAGLINAIANIPGEMGTAVLGGVNPIYALNTLIIGMPVAALLTSTQFMMFDTTSAMTLVAADGLGSRSGDDRAQAMIVIALAAGAFQIALGLLGLGQLTKFVSNAVMTGFLTGIAVSMVLGQLWDLTGYEGTSTGNRLQKTVDLLGHLSEIDLATTVIGVGSLILMFWLGWTKLANYNLLIALAVALVVAWIFRLIGWDSVALVGEVPRSFPLPHLPEFRLLPDMLLTGIAVGAVGLIQAAGVAQRYPNPGGTESDDSRDFLAQGVANVACGFFRAMPGGGSLSGTALNVQTGAKSRLSLVFQGAIALALVLVFSDLLGKIPMSALAALLIYVGILAIKLPAIRSVAASTRMGQVAMIVTFVATLLVPLQQAVILGVILAAVLFLYRSSTDIRIKEVVRSDGHYREIDAPKTLTGNRVTVLDIYGSLFYAGARTLGQLLPSPGEARRAVVVLRLRGHGDVGSTFLDVVSKYAGRLRTVEGKLLLSGLNPVVKERMVKTGHLEQIGEENVFTAEEFIGASTEAAFKAGQALLATTPADEPAPTPGGAADDSDGGAGTTASVTAQPNEKSG